MRKTCAKSTARTTNGSRSVRERAEEKNSEIISEGRGRVSNARAVRQATFIQTQGEVGGEMTDTP